MHSSSIRPIDALIGLASGDHINVFMIPSDASAKVS